MHRVVIISAVLVTTCCWLCCITMYRSALAGITRMTKTLFLPLLFGSMAVGFLAGHALRMTEDVKRMLMPLTAGICALGFLCIGVQAAANWRILIGDLSGGALSGDPGDHYLNSHGTRVRDLTEEEYQYAQEAKWRQMRAFFVMFSSIALGMALHARQVSRTPRSAVEEPVAAGQAGGGPSGVS